MIKKQKIWLLLILFLILFIVISVILYPKQPKNYLDYVSNSPAPSGVKALFTYLNEENIDVSRWKLTPERLPNNNKNQLLIMIEPFFIPDSNKMSAYEQYMEAGNTILLFASDPHGMFDIKTNPADTNSDQTTIRSQVDDKDYKSVLYSHVRLKATRNDSVLLKDSQGIIAMKRSYGNGQLIVTNEPTWLTNNQIIKKDHIELISLLINESHAESILFDEYLHGSNNASSWVTVYPQWFILFIFQGILFTLLWLWNRGKRFGPIFTYREDVVRFSDERIKALASWHLKGKLYHDSLNDQADYIKLLLFERWGIPYKQDWAELTNTLNSKMPHISAPAIQSFLQGLVYILNKQSLSKQEYLLWSKKLDEFRREVEER